MTAETTRPARAKEPPPEHRSGTSPRLETSDLNLASFLRCRGFPFTDLRRDPARTFFVFEDSAELRHAILDYANDQLVPVRSFCNTLRDLKALTR